MATTRLIPMHKIKNQSISYTVHERIDYAINPNKTLGGELVTAFGCDPATAANEMLLTKRAYAPSHQWRFWMRRDSLPDVGDGLFPERVVHKTEGIP